MQKTKLLIVGLILFVLMVPNAGANTNHRWAATDYWGDVPCSEELENVAASIEAGDPHRLHHAVGGFAACANNPPRTTMCLLARNWSEAPVEDSRDYATSLAIGATHHHRIPVFVQVLAIDKGSFFHREVFLTVQQCQASDVHAESVAWGIAVEGKQIELALTEFPRWSASFPN